VESGATVNSKVPKSVEPVHGPGEYGTDVGVGGRGVGVVVGGMGVDVAVGAKGV